MTPLQCITGRAVLDWSLDKLAEKSHVSAPAIARFERGETQLLKLGRLTIEKLFEEAGVLFDENDTGNLLVVAFPRRLEAEHAEWCRKRKEAKRGDGGGSDDAA